MCTYKYAQLSTEVILTSHMTPQSFSWTYFMYVYEYVYEYIYEAYLCKWGKGLNYL